MLSSLYDINVTLRPIVNSSSLLPYPWIQNLNKLKMNARTGERLDRIIKPIQADHTGNDGGVTIEL
jgi:hypothetical protein